MRNRRRISDIFCGYDNDRSRNYNNNGPMGKEVYRPAERPETEQQPEASKSLFGKCKDHVSNNKTAYGLAGAFLAGAGIAIGAEKAIDYFRKDKDESKKEDNKEDSAKKDEQFEEVK